MKGLRLSLSLVGSGLGPELISNGTFDTDATGWTGESATLSVVSGRLRVTNAGGAIGLGYQTIPTLVGERYRISGDLTLGTSGSVRASASNTATGAVITGSGISGAGSKSNTFTATATTTYIRCETLTSTAGETADFDNISVKRIRN